MPVRHETPAPLPGPLVTGAFRQGPRYHTYREHGTRDWLFIYTHRGRGTFGRGPQALTVNPGDVVLLKPRTRHDYATAPGCSAWELWWAHFIPRPEWMEWLDWPAASPGLLHLSLSGHAQRPLVARRLRAMLQFRASPLRLHGELAMNALEEVLLRCALSHPSAVASRVDSRIQGALAFIDQRFAEPLNVRQMAVACGLSPSRFAHLFHRETGRTPQRHLEMLRLNRARQLLEFTQEPVKFIASQVGFANPFYFSLRFKRLHGASPRQWRRNARAQ